VEPSSPSYCELVVPKDPRQPSPLGGKVTATSTLASGGDDHQGSLGTASSKCDGLDSST
jgi:hypothetical protein